MIDATRQLLGEEQILTSWEEIETGFDEHGKEWLKSLEESSMG